MITLSDPQVLPGLSEVTDAIKRHGAIPSIQLLHNGMRSNPNLVSGGKVYGPSSLDHAYGYTCPIYEMDEDMILKAVESFGDAAEMAKLGGVQMVQVHAAHGWLLSQFLSPLTNKRTDKFGGSLENRVRLTMMVCENIKKKCGKEFPIEIRIGGHEYAEGGYDLSVGIEICKMLDDYVDLFHITAGTFSAPKSAEKMIPSMFTPRNNKVELAIAIKKVVKTPVLSLGGFNDPKYMEYLLAEGKVDMIGVGRALLADPFLPEKARTGNEDDIRPCFRCSLCISGNYIPHIKYARRTARCAVNPIIGREREFLNSELFGLSDKPKQNVMVIGGGPGGMQAAITASERGHKVTLFEKADRLGGTLNKAISADFKVDLKHYRDYLINSVNKKDIEIRYNTAVTKELIEDFNPDFMVIAVGAKPIIPNIKGIDRDNVILAEDIAMKNPSIGKNVVIIGGGFTGVEEALSLAQDKDKIINIVEASDHLITENNDTFMHKVALLDEVNKCDNIKIHLKSKCMEIKDQEIIITDPEGISQIIKADTVIISIGYKALEETVNELQDNNYRYAILGDCLKPGAVVDAVHNGYFAGMSI